MQAQHMDVDFHSIFTIFIKQALEWSKEIETFWMTLNIMTASRRLQVCDWQRGKRMPLKKADGLYNDFFKAWYNAKW